jgi:hypothetical protein
MLVPLIPFSGKLFHGSDRAASFVIPDGPAWFALSEDKALEWAEWGKARKPCVRVYTCSKVFLVDLLKYDDVDATFKQLRIDMDLPYRLQAGQFRKFGLAGWLGSEEVMLTFPERYLRPTALMVSAMKR